MLHSPESVRVQLYVADRRSTNDVCGLIGLSRCLSAIDYGDSEARPVVRYTKEVSGGSSVRSASQLRRR